MLQSLMNQMVNPVQAQFGARAQQILSAHQILSTPVAPQACSKSTPHTVKSLTGPLTDTFSCQNQQAIQRHQIL